MPLAPARDAVDQEDVPLDESMDLGQDLLAGTRSSRRGPADLGMDQIPGAFDIPEQEPRDRPDEVVGPLRSAQVSGLDRLPRRTVLDRDMLVFPGITLVGLSAPASGTLVEHLADIRPHEITPFSKNDPNQRKARDSNPHAPRGAHSLAPRPGEPYPATFRSTDHQPMRVDRPGNRTPISWLQARRLPVGRAAHRIELPSKDRESSPRESNPRLPDVSRAPCRWTRGRSFPVAGMGVEPTRTRLSGGRLFQFAYPAIDRRNGLRAWESNPSAERMKLGRAPARPRVPGPGLEPGSRPHEGQRGACPPGSGSKEMRRDGVGPPVPEGGWVTATWARQCPADAWFLSDGTIGIRTHTHQVLSLAARPIGVPCPFL